jgi:hypothetical protein
MPGWSLHKAGRGNAQLRIAYGTKEHSPEVAVLHTNDSYFRLSYGPECGWGTSIVTMPIFWSRGKLHQGMKVGVEWATISDTLILTLNGKHKTLHITQTITLQPPEVRWIAARVYARTSGSLELDSRPGDAFKPVFLSSMHISDLDWDCQSALVADDRLDIPSAGSLMPSNAETAVRRFGLVGGTSRWKKNGPTISVELDEPLPVRGWVTKSTNPNGDNVGLWAAADTVLPSWSYTIHAHAGLLP